VECVRLLPLREGVLDGEIVAVDEAGRPSFQLLQHLGSPGRKSRPILYFAFDLLNLDGKSSLSLPLAERKRRLEEVLRTALAHIRLVPFLEGDAATVLEAIRILPYALPFNLSDAEGLHCPTTSAPSMNRRDLSSVLARWSSSTGMVKRSVSSPGRVAQGFGAVGSSLTRAWNRRFSSYGLRKRK
jgi:hypothetical protein